MAAVKHFSAAWLQSVSFWCIMLYNPIRVSPVVTVGNRWLPRATPRRRFRRAASRRYGCRRDSGLGSFRIASPEAGKLDSLRRAVSVVSVSVHRRGFRFSPALRTGVRVVCVFTSALADCERSARAASRRLWHQPVPAPFRSRSGGRGCPRCDADRTPLRTSPVGA